METIRAKQSHRNPRQDQNILVETLPRKGEPGRYGDERHHVTTANFIGLMVAWTLVVKRYRRVAATTNVRYRLHGRSEKGSGFERCIQVLVPTSQTHPPVIDIARFSSIVRLIRTTAWTLRFLDKLRHKSVLKGPLTPNEIDNAEKFWLRTVQAEAFHDDIIAVQKGELPPRASPLRNTTIFIDDEALLRVSGRIHHSQRLYSERHPIILPKQHFYSKLLVQKHHRKLLHAGVRDTLVDLRQRYWILQGRQLVKKVISECTVCRRHHAKPMEEVVPPLPKDRVTETDPFTVVGIDFAGPLFVRTARKFTKVYLVLFTCAVIRAIHLELIDDQTAPSFLNAFRRFVSRRGFPSVVYTDNALTFKRSKKEVTQLWETIRDPQVKNTFANHKIEWKFILQRAPWWGGFYERLIRSVKLALKKTLGQQCVTRDELVTLLTEVEAVINSRPLTYVFNDSQEPEPLTPAHFLTGNRLTSVPCPTSSELCRFQHPHLHNLWAKRQDLLETFWRRWATEYLLELSSRPIKSTAAVRVGDIVLVDDPLRPRQTWRLARITDLHVGRDGKIRACSVKLADGSQLQRSIRMLYPLEVRSEENS